MAYNQGPSRPRMPRFYPPDEHIPLPRDFPPHAAARFAAPTAARSAAPTAAGSAAPTAATTPAATIDEENRHNQATSIAAVVGLAFIFVGAAGGSVTTVLMFLNRKATSTLGQSPAQSFVGMAVGSILGIPR